MKTWPIVALAACIACDSSTDIDASLEAEAQLIQAWTGNATLVGAVSAQNGQNLTLAVIQARDAAWVANTAQELVTASITGACANQLRTFASAKSIYGEVLLMDNQGALVCASEKTTDYYQGDEDKWTRSYANGQGAVFIDAVRFDQSTGENLAQISVPVKSGATVIGALTVGIRTDRL